MKKTPLMKLIEQKKGKDIRNIVEETYRRYGASEASKILGVSRSTFYNWLTMFDIETKKRPKIRFHTHTEGKDE